MNYRKFCDSWNFSQFFLKSIANMLAYRLNVSAEQFCHLLTIQPCVFIRKTHLQPDGFVGLVHHDFAYVLYLLHAASALFFMPQKLFSRACAQYSVQNYCFFKKQQNF